MNLHAKQIAVTAGNKMICENLTLHLQPGNVWGILGPNGSGKTTLLHALAGLNPLNQGEIWLGEDKLHALSPKTIAKHLAILFQDTHFTFPQTVWDYCCAARFPHLNYFKKESDEDIEIIKDALKIMDLIELKQQYITQLSGGEKRRLAIAAILAQTPAIYLLDEPTNHLDIRHQIKALNHFRQLAETQRVSVMISLHDINLAQQFCNRMLLMFPDGSTISGSPHETLTPTNLTRLYQYPVKKSAIEIFHYGIE